MTSFFFFFLQSTQCLLCCCMGVWLRYVRLSITLLLSCTNLCGRAKASDNQVKGHSGKLFIRCLETRGRVAKWEGMFSVPVLI